jgi:hypothetical protein
MMYSSTGESIQRDSGLEAVAHGRFGQKVSGAGRVVFELAELADVLA